MAGRVGEAEEVRGGEEERWRRANEDLAELRRIGVDQRWCLEEMNVVVVPP